MFWIAEQRKSNCGYEADVRTVILLLAEALDEFAAANSRSAIVVTDDTSF